MGQVPRNVALLATPPPAIWHEQSALTPEQGRMFLAAAQVVHPRVAMEILGHSQISLTMNTYAHVLPDAQREAAAWMDTLFPEVGD